MNYIKIEKESISNGIGIRTVLWISGCSIHCKGCHNKELWDFNSGKKFDSAAEESLFAALSKPYIKGLTLSGGHPLEKQNINKVFELVKKIKKLMPEKDIWLYTGWKLEDIINIREIYKVLLYIDVLVDGEFIEDQRNLTLQFRGSENQRIIDMKKTIENGEIVLWEYS